MAHDRAAKTIVAGSLLAVGLAVGLGLTAGTGEASPGGWPGCPNDHPTGPCHWCPGDPPVQTGNLATNPVRWDPNICHTYWYVPMEQGNVARGIFEGDAPPPPPPPPPSPPFVIDRSNCQQILGIFCPHA